jgi:hypothetical protein
LFLGHLEVVAQAVVGAGLLHWVQVGALQIFDDGDLHRLLVRHVAQDGGYGGFAGQLGGEPAALAGDQWKRLSASGRTSTGCTTPLAAIEAESSLSPLSSTVARVWKGLRSIWSTGISLGLPSSGTGAAEVAGQG